MNSIQEVLEKDPRFQSSKVSDDELKAWREKVDRDDMERVKRQRKIIRERQYENASVWGTSGKLVFKFTQWKPSQQKNQQLARKILDKAIGLTKIITESNFNMLLYGEAGVGKTAMALAIMNAIKSSTDKTVMFVSVMDLREYIMYDFNDVEARQEIDFIEKRMRDVDVLILDDFGSEAGGMKNTGTATERLQQFWIRVAEARQKKDKNGYKLFSNIVTTNNDREDLERMYNKKIVSRLITKKAENTIVFDGLEDLRE
ncbi:IstB-like ATP binding protein [Flyfo myovirus Tbat2_7]|nr:IstB-like ATP binding protein [Flyfo myovirus Tbat2_7]